MRELHTWGGLIFGWLLFVIFLTGTLAVFEPELTHWMKPELRGAQVSPVQAIATADKKLRQIAPNADVWLIRLPNDRSPALEVRWKKDKATLKRYINPQTGTLIQDRQTEGGDFFAHFHYELHSGKAGLWLVSAASLVMLAALVSGIVIRKQVVKDFFRLKWRRTWLDAHCMTGVLTIPFVVLITYTGLVINFMEIMPVAKQLHYKNPAGLYAEATHSVIRPRANMPVDLLPFTQLLPLAEEQLGKNNIAYIQVLNPGDKQAVVNFMRRIDDRILAITDRASFDGVTGELLVSHTKWNTYVYIVRSLVGLHIAKFGGYTVSWIYFLFGLISCVMIAAGLVFFTIKRRNRYARSSLALQYAYRAAEALNTTVVTGGIIACTAYLWANRLLPLSVGDRADAEITVFFCTWLLTMIHSFLRAPLRAWSEQLAVAAGLCLGLPVINALTTKVGLFAAIPRGDWMTAGVDLTAIMLGVLLGATAWYVYIKQNKNLQTTTSVPQFINTINSPVE
ncbi:MAG: hypothetical protein K0R55_672 [Sporomusa sp.]|jgi:uncharacterized iron-regulated membrane protein|nr:hypothetical protein [Sporomusa sp.]